jgi:hypothetical protein
MQMISAWLDLPIAGVFAGLTVFYGGAAALIAWLTFCSPLRARILECSGIVAPYFNAIAILFALLAGFLAADVIGRNKQAIHAVQLESGALSNLHALSLASQADMTAIRQALHAYVDAVVNDEWPRMAEAQTSAKAEAALSALLRLVAAPATGSAVGNVVHDGLMKLTMSAATARSDRLALSSHLSDDIKWATVLFLCLMTQLAIAMVHLERPRAHIAALAVFSLAAIVSLGLIAIQEYPFDGALWLPPAPLEKLLTATAS